MSDDESSAADEPSNLRRGEAQTSAEGKAELQRFRESYDSVEAWERRKETT
jgi:hypothetical protein